MNETPPPAGDQPSESDPTTALLRLDAIVIVCQEGKQLDEGTGNTFVSVVDGSGEIR
jgi:hypothetical protein